MTAMVRGSGDRHALTAKLSRLARLDRGQGEQVPAGADGLMWRGAARLYRDHHPDRSGRCVCCEMPFPCFGRWLGETGLWFAETGSVPEPCSARLRRWRLPTGGAGVAEGRAVTAGGSWAGPADVLAIEREWAMTIHEIGSTVARLLLGGRLRKLREAKGIHAEDAAGEVRVARATLWRMEKGDTRCRYKPGDVELLARFYGANEQTSEALVQLAKSIREHSWVAAYRDLLTPVQEMYLDLEAYAARIRCYVTALVPELLQTEDYAKALIRSSPLLRTYDADKHVRIRMRRQEILTRKPQPARWSFDRRDRVAAGHRRSARDGCAVAGAG